MAVTITLVKRLGSLRGADDQSADALSKIADGTVVRVSLTVPSKRSVKMNNLLFSLLEVAGEQLGWNKEATLVWVKIAVGHMDTIVDRHGEVTFVPKSISFAKMDQQTFNRFFDDAVTAILERLLPPGYKRDELVDEVHGRIGERRAA